MVVTMKFLLREIRFLLSWLVFGFAFMPAILWYANFRYDIQIIIYNANSIEDFYRVIYTSLDDPQAWFCVLIPYLLLRLTLLLFRPKAPRPQASTPLANAAARGREDTVRLLLTQGSDINASNRNGQTPLHLAVNQGSYGVVRLLLEQGAMVDVVETAAGYTPLHYAAAQGHTDLCELLIRFGADPDTPTRDRDSPLHLAVEKGRAGVIGVLLKYRARLDARNRNGMTPLQLAQHLNNREIVNLINRHLSEAWPYLQISRC